VISSVVNLTQAESVKVKVTVKLLLYFLTEHHAMKAYWEEEVLMENVNRKGQLTSAVVNL
jgi:hypothetical protein